MRWDFLINEIALGKLQFKKTTIEQTNCYMRKKKAFRKRWAKENLYQ